MSASQVKKPPRKSQLHLSAIDPEILKKARVICTFRGTTIAKLFRGFLREFIKLDPSYRTFKNATGQINLELSGYDVVLPHMVNPESVFKPLPGPDPEANNVSSMTKAIDKRRRRLANTEPPDQAA